MTFRALYHKTKLKWKNCSKLFQIAIEVMILSYSKHFACFRNWLIIVFVNLEPLILIQSSQKLKLIKGSFTTKDSGSVT